jgi:hypothetical protein
VRLRAREKVLLRVIRHGRVVEEREVTGNTLASDFLTLFRRELTARSDVVLVPPVYSVKLVYGTEVRGSATVTSADVSVDTVELKITVSKAVQITTGGLIDRVVLYCGFAGEEVLMTTVGIAPAVSANAGDLVSVTYTAILSMAVSGQTGLLSDATLEYTNLVVKLLLRLAGRDTTSMRVAYAIFRNSLENPVAEGPTDNDDVNYVVRAGPFTVTYDTDVKSVVMFTSAMGMLLRWIKATATAVRSGSTVSVAVRVA